MSNGQALIVDDSKVVQFKLKRMLEARGLGVSRERKELRRVVRSDLFCTFRRNVSADRKGPSGPVRESGIRSTDPWLRPAESRRRGGVGGPEDGGVASGARSGGGVDPGRVRCRAYLADDSDGGASRGRESWA